MKRKIAIYGMLAALAVVAVRGQEQNNNNTRSATSNNRTLGTVRKADNLIGRDVHNGDHKIGEVKDLVVDLESGRVIYAVVSVGGFLGVNDRSVAVPPSALTEKGKQLNLAIDKQKLMDAPQYNKDDASQLTPQFASKVNQFYGQNAGWMQNSSGETGAQFGNVHTVSQLKGMTVNNTSNKKIAEVENVMIDLSAGRVAYVILSPDKSLNLKDNLYAIPPNALTPSTESNALTTGIDQQKLASAPHFNKDNWPNMSNRSWASQVYQFYGKQPYFDSSLQPTSNTNSLERIYSEPGNNQQQ